MTTAGKPRIIFDTTGLNHLDDSGDESEPLMRGLESLGVILTAMSADEIIAVANNPVRREALLARFGRLLSNARCIWPPHEVIRLLISAYLSDPSRFNWRNVYLRAKCYEDAIPRREFDDALCAEQRAQQFAVQQEFEKAWKSLRPKLDAIIARSPTERPASYADATKLAVMPGGVLWGFGKRLFERVSPRPVDEAEIRTFIEVCPPFRAACYGLVMAWFNWSLRPTHDLPALPGRNDLMMAAYLPFCDRFVTADWAQERDLRLIATAADVPCEVTSLEAFERSFAICV